MTRLAELESILADRLILEDFEGLSLHDGNVLWNLEPGVTYASDEVLRFRIYQDNVRRVPIGG